MQVGGPLAVCVCKEGKEREGEREVPGLQQTAPDRTEPLLAISLKQQSGGIKAAALFLAAAIALINSI